MQPKSYGITVGFINGVITLMFLIVAFNRWNIDVQLLSIPFWTSWILAVFFAYFSYEGFLLGFSSK